MLLHSKLRNLYRCRKLRRLDRPTSADIDRHPAIDSHIAGFHRLQFLDAQIGSVELGFISFGLRMEDNIGLGCSCRQLEQQVGVDGVAGPLKVDIQCLDGFT